MFPGEALKPLALPPLTKEGNEALKTLSSLPYLAEPELVVVASTYNPALRGQGRKISVLRPSGSPTNSRPNWATKVMGKEMRKERRKEGERRRGERGEGKTESGEAGIRERGMGVKKGGRDREDITLGS